MTQQSRRQLLMKAVRDAAIELATRVDRVRYATAPLDNNKPTPDELLVMAVSIESATKGPYLDDKRPTPDEIRSFTVTDLDITAPDELWAAFAINTVNGTRYAGLGRTAAEAKACAWVNSHWPGGTTSVWVKISTKVPNGWTFELYPPPNPKPKMLAISVLAIFELVRLTIPNVTPDEVQDAVMQSLPYMGRRRQ
jgi:hypothetical protein